MKVFLGVDVGTSSTKGVAVNINGEVLSTAVRQHEVRRQRDGLVEMDGSIWWDEFRSICSELFEESGKNFDAVGVSGMGPCVMLTDKEENPTAPSALYGVDSRALKQIASLEQELGAAAIYEKSNNVLSTQSGGPKLRWFSENLPEAYSKAKRFHMPASFLVSKLTGEYILDHQSASQMVPIYDFAAQEWNLDWAEAIAPGIDLPRLAFAWDKAGEVKASVASEIPGLTMGTPVAVGTIDAWAEGVSVGATRVGDLMLMYGTTLFMVANSDRKIKHPAMWSTTGLSSNQWNLAGGMSTTGALTSWIRKLAGMPSYSQLVQEAEKSGIGANGLLMLPYFQGERTPIQDPDARGTITGLHLKSTRGDLYRAALEATAYGIRHNVATYIAAGLKPKRVIGVGGGTQSKLWPQIVSDVIGLPQVIKEKRIGAAYGDAFIAAKLLDPGLSIDSWNPTQVELLPTHNCVYEENYSLYLKLYEATVDIQHALAKR